MWNHHDAEWQVSTLSHGRGSANDSEYASTSQALDMLKKSSRHTRMMKCNSVFHAHGERVLVAEESFDLFDRPIQVRALRLSKPASPVGCIGKPKVNDLSG
jgi:hypothetical protein